MSDDKQEKDRGFTVRDRRRFSESGEAREETESGEAREETASEQVPEPPPKPAPEQDSPHLGSAPSEINFATFIISLSTQALAQLGEIPHPMDNTTHVDLEAARQFIDILGVLQSKTRGNLDEDENALLEHALYDLRMKFVERSQKQES